MKIYCDTDTLFSNVREAPTERAALERLLVDHRAGKIVMCCSQVNRLEVANTKEQETRDKLEADYMALDPVAKEESVSGFQIIPGPTGSFTSDPVSDLNSPVYKECRTRGLRERDTLHILRAVENACDVFLTRDGGIRRRRDWLEKRFSGLKIRLPSQLVAELPR